MILLIYGLLRLLKVCSKFLISLGGDLAPVQQLDLMGIILTYTNYPES